MKSKTLTALIVAAILLPTTLRAGDGDDWTFDLSLYGLAANMSGDVTAKGVSADLDVGFDDVLNNLEFGAMGVMRIGRGDWALTTDVIYTALSAAKGGVSAELDQWVVEPTLSYRVCDRFEVLAGARYNNISGDLTFSGPTGRVSTGTQDWWDPIVGGSAAFPLNEKLSLNVRGDIGGFGVGSDLTWQAFPHLNWRISKCCSLQAGYRWIYTDYESGSGANRFAYDVLTQGPQLGLTIRL